MAHWSLLNPNQYLGTRYSFSNLSEVFIFSVLFDGRQMEVGAPKRGVPLGDP